MTWLQLSGVPTTTRRTRRGQVRSVAQRSRTQHPNDLTFAHLVTLCSERAWSNEHQKGVRRALISFFEWACSAGLTAANPALKLPKVAVTKPRPRPAPNRIWDDLLANADPRERMMARLACEVGMRRAEVAVAHCHDLIEDMNGSSILIHGKGGKQRVMPISDSLANDIRKFCPHGYLFPGQIDGHVSAHHVGKIISALMPDGWSMHKLRHRFATLALAKTGNLRLVQEAMGHSSPATTALYTAVAPSQLRAIVDPPE